MYYIGTHLINIVLEVGKKAVLHHSMCSLQLK